MIVCAAMMAQTALAQDNVATLTGKIKDYTGSTVYLMNAADLMAPPSPVTVNADGSFTLQLPAEQPNSYFFVAEQPKGGFKFFVEKGMKADVQISFQTETVEGEEQTKWIVDYTGDDKACYEYFENPENTFYLGMNNALTPLMGTNPTFKAFREKLREETNKFEETFMKVENPAFQQYMKADTEQKFQSALIWYTELNSQSDPDFIEWMNTLDRTDKMQSGLYAMGYKKYCLPAEGDQEVNYFKALPTILSKERATELADEEIGNIIPSAPANLADIFEAYKQVNPEREVPAEIQQLYDLNIKMIPGQPAVDFDMYTVDGKKVMLSDLKGRAVYIDCWATWCGPCKAETPHMKALYEHYKDDSRLLLVSISMDTNHKAWENMVAKEQLAWPQYIVQDAFDCLLCKTYSITGIPRFMMFDKDGCVVSLDAPRPSNPDIIPFIDAALK